jgi:hypothetical protein
MKDAAAEPAGIAIVTLAGEAAEAAAFPGADAELPEVLVAPPALLQAVTARATTAPAAATRHLYRFMPSLILLATGYRHLSLCPKSWASGRAGLGRLFDSASPEPLFVPCFSLSQMTDGFSTKHRGKAAAMWIYYYGNCIQNARPG